MYMRTSAAKMKVAFIKARKNVTGNLDSDFNKIQQGDPVFNFHKNGTVSHEMPGMQLLIVFNI